MALRPACLSIAAAFGLVLLLPLDAGASMEARTTQSAGGPQSPAIDSAGVEILRAEPRRPRIRIREVAIEALARAPAHAHVEAMASVWNITALMRE